jgi:hypothetical protein
MKRALAFLSALGVLGLLVSHAIAVPPAGAPGRDPDPSTTTTTTRPASTSTSPPPASTCVAKTYSAQQILTTLSLTTPAASEFWCGNLWRKPGRDLNPKPDYYPEDNNEFASTCHSMKKKDDGTWVPAQMQAEVRGWIRWMDGNVASDYQSELAFDVEPDIDWQPATSAVYAVNTFERVAQWMHPVGAHNRLGRFHVEYDMWGPNRICGYHGADWLGHIDGPQSTYFNKGAGPYCASYMNGLALTSTPRRPPEWCFQVPGIQAYFPFDTNHPPRSPETLDGAFKVGDYVRIVGTLWEDHNHASADPCFDDGHTKGRGWTEIHPVDFIARMSAPPGVTGSPVAYIGACMPSSSSDTLWFGAYATPRPAQRPGPNFKLNFREVVDPDFTNFQSLAPASSTPSGRMSIVNDVGKASVQVSSVQGVRKGLFRGVYVATWDACTPQCAADRCGGDNGCGQTCAATCPSGKTCNASHCCPNGTRFCGGSQGCAASCTSPPPCVPCDCGGTACAGSAACIALCRAQGQH